MDAGERGALRRLFQNIHDAMGEAAEGAVRRFAPGGKVPTRAGGTGTTQGAEPPLGNPASDGQVLASTTGGVRSWITPGGLDAEQVDDRVAALLVAGPGIALDYDDPGDALTVRTAETYGVVFTGSGEVALTGGGAIVTKVY